MSEQLGCEPGITAADTERLQLTRIPRYSNTLIAAQHVPQAALEKQGLPCPDLAHHPPESLNIITVVVCTHLLMCYRVQAGYAVEAGRCEGHRPQDLPAALCAGPAAEGQPCHALPAPSARQRQARGQPAGLTWLCPTACVMQFRCPQRQVQKQTSEAVNEQGKELPSTCTQTK